ncbi:magnesium transporter MgtC [Bifidobacterium aemilianum]|uniref:Magnesium transporter MgtC n=1 Tax=Bifidobacterium aemilianum TaxID=2493120 RepID=A0A366KA68_9BIFI|nr:magnesium transporter MgtC [Bifidobacterium aemilianum]
MDLNVASWGWQAIDLLSALILSTAIGVERQARHKDAGTRTHALVGLGSALFMLISKYGFNDVLAADLVRLDPSRIAAQIVSGIGFIGAGVVFMQRSRIRGLTTAASIWLTAALGSACGAGMIIQSVICTVCYFVVVLLFPVISRFFSVSLSSDSTLHIEYVDGHGVLRKILTVCAAHGVMVEGFSTQNSTDKVGSRYSGDKSGVSADLEIRGSNLESLIAEINALDGITSITGIKDNE